MKEFWTRDWSRDNDIGTLDVPIVNEAGKDEKVVLNLGSLSRERLYKAVEQMKENDHARADQVAEQSR